MNPVLTIDGLDVPLLDWRIAMAIGRGPDSPSQMAESATYSEYERLWLRFIDRWKGRYGRPPTMVETLLLANSFVKAAGSPPQPKRGERGSAGDRADMQYSPYRDRRGEAVAGYHLRPKRGAA